MSLWGYLGDILVIQLGVATEEDFTQLPNS